MELRHLRYFIAAAEDEHFGRAADRLHITRPAVSQIIADLEDELGTLLFERLAHGVKLTAAGRALLPQLKVMMSDLNQALVMAKRIGEGKTGALRIGYGTLTLLHPLFRAVVKKFHEQYPEVTLSLIEIASSEQTKALSEGRIHAGFMHFPPSAEAFRKNMNSRALALNDTVLERFKIQSGSLRLVVPNDHRLAKRKSVSLSEIAEDRFVVIPHSTVSPGYGSLSSLCKKAGFEPRVVQEVASVTTLLNLVAVGVGIGLTVAGKDFVFPPSLSVVRLKDVSYTTTFALGWLKGPIEPVLERLIETVKELA